MSDKVVNVYVGECFQDGAQVGGEGKTYGLTLTGNKLKLVENGQQSEVDLPDKPSNPTGVPEDVKQDINNLKSKVADFDKYKKLIYVMEGIFPEPSEVFFNGTGGYIYINGEGDLSNPYTVRIVGIDGSDLLTGFLVGRSVTFINGSASYMRDTKKFNEVFSENKTFYYAGNPIPYDHALSKLDLSSVPKGTYAITLSETP
jgi:hypothetical protein